MSTSWVFSAVQDQTPSKIFPVLQGDLNKLTAEQSQSVKVFMSDAVSGTPAFGGILFFNGGSLQPSDIEQGEWAFKTFKSGKSSLDELQDLSRSAAKFLEDSLSETQQYYAKATLSDAEHHELRLTIWYPDDS